MAKSLNTLQSELRAAEATRDIAEACCDEACYVAACREIRAIKRQIKAVRRA